jgi:hypothetical protein
VSLVASFLVGVERDIHTLEREGAASMHYVKERVASRSWSHGSSCSASSDCSTSVDISVISVNSLRKKSRGACLLCSVDGLGGKHKMRHPRCAME